MKLLLEIIHIIGAVFMVLFILPFYAALQIVKFLLGKHEVEPWEK